MATVEALAWGYLGFAIGAGGARVFAAALSAIAMFVVVWAIDVSFLTFDLASTDHAISIFGEHPEAHRSRRVRLVASVLLRVVLVATSFTVTAPYLAQLVFYEDVAHSVSSEATKALDAVRSRLDGERATAEAGLNNEMRTKRSEYEAEVAGKGRSGRYGTGPAADAILRSIPALEARLNTVIADHAQRLADFNRLASDWRGNRDYLEVLYNITLPQSSLVANRRAFEALRTRPETRSVEFAVRVFLGLIFGAILLLKLFEPHSVRLYLSEVLQQEYDRYCAGVFDSLLPETERSTVIGYELQPQRLAEFLSVTWHEVRTVERRQAAARAASYTAVQELTILTQLEHDAMNGAKSEHVGQTTEQQEVAQRRLRTLSDMVGESSVKRTQSELARAVQRATHW